MADRDEIIKAAMQKLAAQQPDSGATEDVVLPTPDVVMPQEEVVAEQPEVVLPQATDMYAQGAATGKAMQQMLPEVSLPQITVPEVIAKPASDIWGGIKQNIGAVFSPSSARQPASIPTIQPAVQPVVVAAPAPTQPIQPAIKVTTEPTAQEVQKKVDEALQPEKDAKARDLASTRVADKIKEQQQQQQSILDDVERKRQEIDAQVRVKSLPELMSTGSFGQKLGAALAIAIGGISQGLTGAKSNPALDMIDKLVEQQAQKDKLNSEEYLSLKKQATDAALLELKKSETASENAYRKQQIDSMKDALKQKSDDYAAAINQQLLDKQLRSRLNSGKALTPDEVAGLTDEQLKRKVTLQGVGPAGGQKVALAGSYEDANKFKEKQAAIEDAVGAVDELKKLGKDPLAWANFFKRGEAELLSQKLVGQLRLPYTGPGVLTDDERKRLIEIIGNPTKLFALSSVEAYKLDKLKEHLQAQLQTEARVRGINETVVPQRFYNVNGKAITEDNLVLNYKKLYPKLSTEQIKRAIDKQGIPEL